MTFIAGHDALGVDFANVDPLVYFSVEFLYIFACIDDPYLARTVCGYTFSSLIANLSPLIIN